jgi:CD109 antigen
LTFRTSVSFCEDVPDSITSWIITGFSVSPEFGLGLTKSQTKLTVFRPFFVTTNLPYSIKRGEVTTLSILVFNYMDNDQTAEITLFNSNGEFEFVMVDPNSSEKPTDEIRKKSVNVPAQSGVTVAFIIRATKVGSITIKVTGTTPMAGDGLEKQLTVEAEGVTQYINQAVLIDLTKTDSFNTKLSVTVPPKAVKDSIKVEVSAIGDVLGPTLENIDRLM